MIKNIPEEVLGVIETIQENGKEAYLVGGCVRDSILGLPPKDYDITTNALPGDIVDYFSSKPNNRIILTGIEHGTVTILKNKNPIEVTTFMGDNNEFCNHIADDLGRRDFTINAIAYDPINKTTVDPYGGIPELKNDIVTIRTVGNSVSRFVADPARILRSYYMMTLVEKANKYWELDKDTLKSITELKHLLAGTAPERQRDVLFKILTCQSPEKVLKTMAEHGVLFEVIPEMAPMAHMEQNKHHTQDVLHHTFSVINNSPNDLVTRVAALLHDIGKPVALTRDEKNDEIHFYEHEKIGAPIANTILRRLKCSNELRHQVVRLVETHMQPLPNTPYQARQKIVTLGDNLINKHIDLRAADLADQNFKEEKIKEFEIGVEKIQQETKSDFARTIKDLAISGKDLMELYQEMQGVVVGKTLEHLFQLTLAQPEINTREKLLSIATKYIEKNYGVQAEKEVPNFSGKWFLQHDPTNGITYVSRKLTSVAVKLSTNKVIDGSEMNSVSIKELRAMTGINVVTKNNTERTLVEWLKETEIKKQLPHDALYKIAKDEYITLNPEKTTELKPIFCMSREEYKNIFEIQGQELNWHGTSSSDIERAVTHEVDSDRVLNIITNGFSPEFEGITYCTVDEDLAKEHAIMMAEERNETPMVLPVYILKDYEPKAESGMDSDAFPNQGLLVEHEYAVKYALERGVYDTMIDSGEMKVEKVEKICATYGLEYSGIKNIESHETREYDASDFM